MFYSLEFNFIEQIFGMFFIIFIVFFIIAIIKNLQQWNKNNESPRLTVDVYVTDKRKSVSHVQHPNAGDATGAHGFHTTTSQSYYITVQVESGDTMEFCVSNQEYSQIQEGDYGRLTFQGTRFLGFELKKQ